jgi:hypothetical protein
MNAKSGRKTAARSEVEELPETKGGGAPEAGGPPETEVVEYDPARAAEDADNVEVPEMEETADTLSVEEGLFGAQERLESLLGGSEGIMSALSKEAGDYQMDVEQVVGTSIGFRFFNGALTSDIALKVLVNEVSPTQESALLSNLPAEVSGHQVIVEEVGEIVPQMYNRRFARPVRCGVSIGHPAVTAGTLGCLVVLNNNRLCLLSNNHVIASSNNARRGDNLLQPGVADGGRNPADRIAILENFVPIAFPGPNLVDAAVGWTSFANVSPRHVTYRLNPAPLRARLGMTVMKNGRTTQATLGTVTDISANINVGYPGGVAQFRNQVGVRGIGGVFSRGGDSGSVIVTANTKQPVALLFAGRRDNSVTFANPIAAVIAALGIRRFLS